MEYKLYHGQSEFLSLESVHKYIDMLRSEQELKLEILNADTISPNQLIDILSSQDLFSSTRIILFKRLYRNKQKDEFFTEFVSLVKTGKIKDLLIFWEDQKIKSNTKYYKFFSETKAIEESPKLDKRSFFSWLKNKIKEMELEINEDAIKVLAERINYDPERCTNELRKLKLTVENSTITLPDVESLVSDTLENDIWNLIDAINQKDSIQSSTILERLMAQNIDSNYIISMLARNLRLITLTKYLLEESGTTGNIAKRLKVPPFTVPSLINSSKKYSKAKIRTLYSKMSNLDYQIKKGLIDPDLGITLLSSIL
ncbi:MAG TPA: DNA polymerase III subunit delta [Candidatus Dojkabacteria bacterium]|nr:DNA polymerase III subunit delta [Candidatus Dojkabacteria bacterium]